MRQSYLCFTLLFSAFLISSLHAQELLWKVPVETSYPPELVAVPDPAGNVYLGTIPIYQDYGTNGPTLKKVSTTGALLWQITTPSYDQIDLAPGGVYGHATDSRLITPGIDTLFYISANGEVRWQFAYEAMNIYNRKPAPLKVDSKGNVYLCQPLYAREPHQQPYVAKLVKIDTTGRILFAAKIPKASRKVDVLDNVVKQVLLDEKNQRVYVCEWGTSVKRTHSRSGKKEIISTTVAAFGFRMTDGKARSSSILFSEPTQTKEWASNGTLLSILTVTPPFHTEVVLFKGSIATAYERRLSKQTCFDQGCPQPEVLKTEWVQSYGGSKAPVISFKAPVTDLFPDGLPAWGEGFPIQYDGNSFMWTAAFGKGSFGSWVSLEQMIMYDFGSHTALAKSVSSSNALYGAVYSGRTKEFILAGTETYGSSDLRYARFRVNPPDSVPATVPFSMPDLGAIELYGASTTEDNTFYTLVHDYSGSHGTMAYAKYRFPPLPSGTKAPIAGIMAKPLRFQLDQNWPNPFNPKTSLSFSVAEPGVVTLKVYSMLGQEVATLVDETMGAGEYVREWNATNVASGTYLCRLQEGNNIQMRKIVLMK